MVSRRKADTPEHLAFAKYNFEGSMSISEIHLVELPSFGDERGILTSIEETRDVPIEIKRVFYMHGVKHDRGGHAHIDTDQVVIPLSGRFSITAFDGKRTVDFLMNDATKGLYIPRLIYVELRDFSPGAVCLVLANTHYDMKRSLRSREEYLEYLHDDTRHGASRPPEWTGQHPETK
jgi:dTDP-4-dehydrorhamnose 3,5-epimerase-like enzyme